MPLSEQTKERLRETVEFIGLEPKRLDMREWVSRHGKYSRGNVLRFGVPDCGTVACLAGWRVMLDSLESGEPFNPYAVGPNIANSFGLTPDDADKLFLLAGWPMDLYIRYRDATTPEEAFAALQERVERFIATDGAA